jgi:alkanesulfonate monooxygenase SsuD/methylene tetrahydromethanopterin reductase-like flavin-dependent oxidoreductase (luciferase family)
VKLFVSLPAGTREGAGDPRALVEIGRQADEAGIDGVIIAEHVVMGNRTDRYQWGEFPFPPEAPWLEPLTVLTAMAAVTERIVLTTGILIVPLRPATLLAKIVATIDHLSGGRLELGVGTGPVAGRQRHEQLHGAVSSAVGLSSSAVILTSRSAMRQPSAVRR